MKQIRQGDVFLEKAATIGLKSKVKARDAGRVVLAYGEVTGHAHAIDADGVTMYEDENGVVWLSVETDDAVLRHEEHAAIPVPRGTYRVRHQREYTPKAPRRVAD